MRQSILLVDDSVEFRMLAQAALTRAGYEVSSVSNGIEGLHYIEKHGSPDLLLSDIEMPEMDGIEMVAELRRHPQTACLRVVFVSGHSLGQALVSGSGNSNFVAKGSNVVANLVSEVRRVLMN